MGDMHYLVFEINAECYCGPALQAIVKCWHYRACPNFVVFYQPCCSSNAVVVEMV